MAATNLILFDIAADGVAILTLNRPEKLNAFTPEMLDRWNEILVHSLNNPAVKVIVLTGAGKGFCSGGDTGDIHTRSTQYTIVERKDFMMRRMGGVALNMERLDKPVIAAINGAARGGGMDMALMCDIRIMAESATLGESYINMGLVAGAGGAYYLPRMVGLDHALDILWTGRTITAQEAKEIGIVTRVVPDKEVLAVALELARRIAAQPHEAVRAYKRVVYQSRNINLATHLDMVSSQTSLLRETSEHRERIAGFSAKKTVKA